MLNNANEHPLDLVRALDAEIRARPVRPTTRLDVVLAAIASWLLRRL